MLKAVGLNTFEHVVMVQLPPLNVVVFVIG